MASEEFSGNERQNELLRITESAFNSVMKPQHSQVDAGVKNVHRSSGFVTVTAPVVSNADESSSESHSTTTSKVLINSTNRSTRPFDSALSVPGLPGRNSPNVQTSQIVKMPASVLREVTSPRDDSLPRDDYIVDASDERIVNISVSRRQTQPLGPAAERPAEGRSESGRLRSSVTGKAAGVPSGKKISAPGPQIGYNETSGEQFSSRPSTGASHSTVLQAIPSRNVSRPVTSATDYGHPPVRLTKKDQAHPLMVMLDSGYLTQPIHAVVAEEAAASLASSRSSSSPIVVHAKNMEMSQTESESAMSSDTGSSQPEIITVSGVTMPVLSTAAASVDSSDTENMSARPFVALKDRFHQFRPIMVKQGMETSDSSAGLNLGNVDMQSDELRIEQFALNDKQHRLRQEFVHRKGMSSGSAVKKVVPAHVVPMTHTTTAADEKPDIFNDVKSSATSADAVATAAVAAVLASHTFLKTQQDLEKQMNEVLAKISTLQEASHKRSEPTESAVHVPLAAVMNQTDPDADKYRKKLEELEAQLTGVTRHRLDYLERLQQQHFDIQMQLLAMGQQQTNPGHVRSHTYDAMADKLNVDRGLSAPARPTKSDTSLLQDVEREKTSLLDTPAPRRQRPVPTFYEPVHTRLTTTAQQDVEDQHQLPPTQHTPSKLETASVGSTMFNRQNMYRSSSTASQTNGDDALVRLNKAQHYHQAATKQLNDTFSLTPEKRLEHAPLDKYLVRPMKSDMDISPYPMLKKSVASHMPALLQYAEVEAVLKKVHATSNRLETNLNMVLKTRQDLDSMDSYGNDDNGSLAERIRVRKLVDERVQAIARRLEVEIEEEKLQLENEKNRRMMEAERDGLKAKKSRVALNYRDRSYRSADMAAPKVGRAAAEKENIPKKAPITKPRPLDPVRDEEYMKRIYGKALYHKQRNAQKEACERYHGSPKSKLPRSPVKLSRAVVNGIEVATAKTQTSMSTEPLISAPKALYNGGPALKGQFVVGLQGKLIPVAIPVELPVQRDYGPYGRPASRPPPRQSITPSRTPSPVKEIPPADITKNEEEQEEEEEEEEEPESMGEKQPISLPGYTAPPIHYEGPEFPIRSVPPVHEPEPETTADELAAKIRRTDMLQTEVVDWVEQELMARIIAEMYEKRSFDPVHYGLPVATRKSSEDATDKSSVLSDVDASESFMVDAIGQHGVQMFVDAGRPVDDMLVAALVRDVLAEKIAAMLGERAELDRIARRDQESRQPSVPTAANGGITQTSRLWKSPVTTPQPTPVQSPVPSRSQSPSPLSTPLASMAAVSIPVELVEPTAAKEASEDTEDFPSYTGVSDIESEKEAVSLPFVERHDVNTPSVTPSRSPVPSLGTPSLSQEFVPPPPVETSVPLTLQPAIADVKDASVECQLLPVPVQPASPIATVSPRVPSPDTESDSAAPPTEEESTTNVDGVSEGQWLINVLSEGEVPDVHLNEGLKHRIRQHLMNASRRRQSLDNDDTIAASDELDQDEQIESLPSDGEILLDSRPLAEHAALLEVLKPRNSAIPAPVAPVKQRKAAGERYRSMGEVSIGEAQPVQNFKDVGSVDQRSRHQAVRRESSDGEQPVSRWSSGEFQADNKLSAGEDRRGDFDGLHNRSPTASLSDAESLSPPAARQSSPTLGKYGAKRRPTAGPVRSTIDPTRRNQLSRGGNSLPRSESPLHNRQSAGSGLAVTRVSVEASDQYSRTATPDQINTDALLASRDYFNTTSDFGATASSAGEPRAHNPRAMFSPQNTGDSTQYQTDELGSTGGWPSGKGGRESRDMGQSVDSLDEADNRVMQGTYKIDPSSSRPKLDIKMPAMNDPYNDEQSGSDDDDVSELSIEP